MIKLNYLVLAAALILANISSHAIVAFASDSNLIANPSVETVSGITPTSWTPDSWGNNSSTLTVSSDAHSGTKGLNTTVTSYTDGDAKWIPTSANISPNTVYTYSSWYKSTVSTEIDLMYTDQNGAVTYTYLDTPAPASSWTHYTTSFTTPSNASLVSVLQIVAKPGSLTTDDFSLVKYSAPVATGSNLIANPSFETSNGASPAGWQQDSWGANSATFLYEGTGRSGTRSATVTIGQYTNGDAKWGASPATVTAGESYTYNDYYKSSVASRIVAAFTLSDGTIVYSEMNGANAAADWTAYSTTFTAPAKAVSAVIYHLLDKTGSLTIDDTSLTVAVQTPPPTANGSTIANASAELTNGTQPANWTRASWGTNTSAFSYESNGHTGSHSLMVSVSGYTDGDAKWMFDPITGLDSNKQYVFSAWYKGSVNPSVVAQYTLNDGSTYYANLPAVTTTASTSNWQQYTGMFTTPANVKNATVFMLVNTNGWVQTDDYNIAAYTPTGFARGLVSLTFDDGWATNATNVAPILKQYGFKSTQYIISGYIGDSADGYMTAAQIKSLQYAGNEVGSHTVSHPHLPLLSPSQLTSELAQSKSTLTSTFGTTPTDFASPYGEYSANVNGTIKQYYTSHRTTDTGYNSKDSLDLYAIKVQNILNTTTPAQVAAWVKQSQTDKTWLVLVYHQVDTTPDTYDSSIANFKSEMANLKSSGIAIKTMKDAITEVSAQK